MPEVDADYDEESFGASVDFSDLLALLVIDLVNAFTNSDATLELKLSGVLTQTKELFIYLLQTIPPAVFHDRCNR